MSDHNNNITCQNTSNATNVDCRWTSITEQRELDEDTASSADKDAHESISGSRLRKPENGISSQSAATSSSSSSGSSDRIETRPAVAMSNHERVGTVPRCFTSTTSNLDDRHVTPSTGYRAGDDQSQQKRGRGVVDRIVESVSNDLSELDDGISEETLRMNVPGETTDNTSSFHSSELCGDPAVASPQPTTNPQPQVGQLNSVSVTGVHDDDVNAGRQTQKGSRGSTEGRNIFNEFIFSVLRKLLMADDSTMKTPTNQNTVSNLIDWRPAEETSSGEEDDDDDEEEDYRDSDDDDGVDAFPDGGRIGSQRGHGERVADEIVNRLTCTCDDCRHHFSVTSSSAELHSSAPDVELSTGVGQSVPPASRDSGQQQSTDGQSVPLRYSDRSAIANEQSSLPPPAVLGGAHPLLSTATRPSDCRSINVDQMGLEDALRFVITSSRQFQSAVVTTPDATASFRETDV